MLVSAIAHPATSGALTDAGIWAAIAAAVFAFALIVAALVGAGKRYWTASDIHRALHVDMADMMMGVPMEDGSFVLHVGLNVRNGAAIPLSYLPTEFTVQVGEWTNRLTDPVERQDLGPSEADGFFRDVMTINAPLPVPVIIEYTIKYGKLAKRYSRSITGAWETTLQPFTPDGPKVSFRRGLRASRDERLRRWRKKYQTEVHESP